jgi:Ca2+-binding RTX toxin-like protein
LVGGFGDDSIGDLGGGGGTELVFGNEGNDTVQLDGGGADTVFAGLGNDSVSISGAGNSLFFLNEGADTIDASASLGDVIIVGGNDSADAGDSIIGGTGTQIIFGNGGADSILGQAACTLVGGQGDDFAAANAASGLFFGNEGNDTLGAGGPANTIFGGLGNDFIFTDTGTETLQGNEGNDTIQAGANIDTISGGTGNDLFVYTDQHEDGDNATGGGPVERITDVDFAADRFATAVQPVTFASNLGAGSGANLNAAATNAVAAAFALAGGTGWVAAQFTFAGHTYLAIDQTNAGAFADNDDLLLDITGATGTIGAGNFIGGGPPLPSDVRLKRDIVELERLASGIGLYRYRYAWSDQLFVGVMAQEVATVVPHAVTPDDDGYLRVDYARLGMRLQTWEQWSAADRPHGSRPR